MSTFLDRIKTHEILVADGATGTNLQKVGLTSGMHPEDWVLDQPDKILDLEEAFVKAGSNIILTCTFGGTRVRLKGAVHENEAAKINRTAAGLAKQAAARGEDVLVAGSMGPLGQLLKPLGPLAPDEARAAYEEQAEALAEAGVDLLVIETQYSLEEADIALAAARAKADLPIVVSFSFDRGTRTMMGVRPADVVARYRAAGVTMIGANCGTTLENIEKILEAYAGEAPDFPYWIKPNAGMPRLVDGRTIYDVTPAEMGEFAGAAVRQGARVIGGCCGSTPEHVAAIAKAAKNKVERTGV